MRAMLPLVRDTAERLERDTYLPALMNGKASFVFTERPPSDEALPFVVLDFTQLSPWNNQSDQGSEFVMQVSAFFARGEQSAVRGIDDAGQAAERIRIALDYVDGIDLDRSPTRGAKSSRLILRQYVSGLPPTPDPDGKFLQVAARFRCLVSDQ
jgi:hypothetical protein